MTDEELKELVASLAVGQRELQLAQKHTDEQLNRLEKQVEKMARKIDHVGDIVDGVSKNQGAVAEEFFFNSLAQDNHLGTIHFDGIAPNMSMRLGRLEEEYDIVMTNGNAVGIVEVKYKAHEKDLEKLERKMRNFKTLFPVYKDYKLYGAIASFNFYDKAKQEALNQGFFVLQRSGNVVQTDCGENLLVM
jgi:Holliday junction resolvase-like predicted endonuclease